MFRIISILCVCVVLCSCVSLKFGYFDDDKRLAQDAIAKFHIDYNNGAYEDIYESAHPDAKATKSKTALVNVLTGIKASLGNEVSSQLVKATVAVANNQEREVDMLYRTKFEKGEVNELFLVFSDGNVARIHSLGQPSDDEVKAFQFRGEPR